MKYQFLLTAILSMLTLVACEDEGVPLDGGSSDAGSDTSDASTSDDAAGLCEAIPMRRERCIEDMRREEFLGPFRWAVVGIPEGATPDDILRRFVSTDTSELSACSENLDLDWSIWAGLWTTNAIYNDHLSGCDEFLATVGDQFGARLQAMTAAFDDCLFAEVFPDRDDYVQRLRDAGTLAEMSYFLTGITPAAAAEIPETCTHVDCTAAALFGDRAHAILNIANDTGYILQDWGNEGTEQQWGEAEIDWMGEALRTLLDCDRFGATYQFKYFPAQHIRTNSEMLDASFGGTGVSVSRYFMVDGADAPSPERLRFVLGHELAHAASDELSYRRGFDPSVFDFDRNEPTDPELYFDANYIAELAAVVGLGHDILVVGGARHPMGFREADLVSGAANPFLFSQPRALPYARNPPTVSVGDMYSDTPTYYDGFIRSENPRSYRELLADLLIGYTEFPSLFFHDGLFIAPRGYFYIRENFFGGRNAFGLTPAQQAQVDRYEPLSIAERNLAHQTDAATLRNRYCVDDPDTCLSPELPEPTTPNERVLFDRLTQLSVRGREARLAALRTTLDGAGVTFVEEVGVEDELRTTNLVVTLGSGTETVMLGAHWDGLQNGRGVVDNGSGVASLIQVAQRLSADPPDGTVRIVFFDREEEGLVGSRSFVAAHQSDLPPLYLNLDMCGYGDTLLVGPTTGSESLLPGIRSVAASLGQRLGEFPEIPGTSDHESFLEAGVPAISFSMMSQVDVTLLERLNGGDFSELAPIFKIIHTQDDSLHRIEPAALVRCAVYLEALVRSL